MPSVRVLSGINSRNFWAGYDRETRVFDKRKTPMLDTWDIHCVTDANGERPALGEPFTQLLLGYSLSTGMPPGERYLMSGLVDEDALGKGESIHRFRAMAYRKPYLAELGMRSGLGKGNYTYRIGPTLHVDRLYRLRGGIVRPRRLVDVSARLRPQDDGR